MTKKYRVFVPGAWDLFHVGHLALLSKASNIASTLYVGVDTDQSIKEKKGSFPIIPFSDRMTILRACAHVSHVVANQSGSICLPLLQQLQIDAVVLADSWKYKHLEGKKEANASGIKFIYFPYTSRVSSTQIREKIITLSIK